MRREGRMVKSRRENATESGTPLLGRFYRIYPNRQKIFSLDFTLQKFEYSKNNCTIFVLIKTSLNLSFYSL